MQSLQHTPIHTIPRIILFRFFAVIHQNIVLVLFNSNINSYCLTVLLGLYILQISVKIFAIKFCSKFLSIS